jgi:glycosyltransferase involved in cell wall biosynthesis
VTALAEPARAAAASGPAPRRIGVLQVIDSLELGGAERVAVNLANALPRDRFVPYLTSTRARGPLQDEIAPDVRTLFLDRGRRWDDLPAAVRLARFIRRNEIRIVHCHKATVLLGSVAHLMAGSAKLLWHDHWGLTGVRERSTRLYRVGTFRAAGVIGVNEGLCRWAIEELHHPPERVWYVPNFVMDPRPCPASLALPGTPGRRIVCVARVAPQKDLLNLVAAMARVVEVVPDAHALVLGVESDPEYGRRVREEIARRGLGERVWLLGGRTDATDVVQSSDIGVLSSAGEGLPLALVEYGLCRRPSVATRVGQCADVLDGGDAGILVPPHDPQALADALVRLLQSPEERERLAQRAWRHAMDHHSVAAVMRQITGIYDTLLAEDTQGRRSAQPSP